MANNTLDNVRLALRNDTLANWNTQNPVLLKGEIGVVKDTTSDSDRFKIGDGIKTWSALDYATVPLSHETLKASPTQYGHIALDSIVSTKYFRGDGKWADLPVPEPYVLPTASASVLGGIKVGTNLSISSGVLSATDTKYTASTGLSLSGNAFSVKYGTTAGTAAQGNDSRLSDARTPKSHTHGNIANDGTVAGAGSDGAVLGVDSAGNIEAITGGGGNSVLGRNAVSNYPVWRTLGISDITGLSTALDHKLNASLKGAKNGVASLDADGLVPSTQLPSYVDDVIEAANLTALNNLPTAEKMQGKIYVTLNDNKTYRWSGSAFIEISNPISYASQSDAETGTENTKVMTALRVKQAITKNMPTGLPPTGTAGGDLTGTYPNPTIGALKVTGAKIANKTITGGKIADGTIDGTQIAPIAITNAKIANNAVTDGKIVSLNATKLTLGANDSLILVCGGA